MTSSHESIEFEAQKFPPSLILEEIQRVWNETAIPARQVRMSPENTLPRSVPKEGIVSERDAKSVRPTGRIIKSPTSTGITYSIN
jgi:hypothetical protein